MEKNWISEEEEGGGGRWGGNEPFESRGYHGSVALDSTWRALNARLSTFNFQF